MSSSSPTTKLVVCDVDRTLTGQNSWYTLTQRLGADVERHYSLYQELRSGARDAAAIRRDLIEMYVAANGGPISRAQLYDLFFSIPLRGEAFSTFKELKSRGIEVAIISSSIDMFVSMVAERLQIEHWFANSLLKFDADDHLVDFDYNPQEAVLKHQQMQSLITTLGISPQECLVFGDGGSDAELFRHYRGIAVDSESELLNDLAWKRIKYLPSVIQLLEQ